MKLPAGFEKPFYSDGRDYVFDAKGDMAASREDDEWLPRGWGRIQYLSGANLQWSSWVAWFDSCVERTSSPQQIVDSLNQGTP